MRRLLPGRNNNISVDPGFHRFIIQLLIAINKISTVSNVNAQLFARPVSEIKPEIYLDSWPAVKENL
jgi:hypothetical protein